MTLLTKMPNIRRTWIAMCVICTVFVVSTVTGVAQIDNCVNDKIDITIDENNPTDIKCSGLFTNYSVLWEVFYPSDINRPTVVLANCSPGTCTNSTTYVRVYSGITYSTLQIVQNSQQVASGDRVRCNVIRTGEQPFCALQILAPLPTVTIYGAENELQVGSRATLRCGTVTNIPETSLSYTWSGVTCDASVSIQYYCLFTAQANHNLRQVTCVIVYKDYPYIPGKSATLTLHVATSVTVSPTTKPPEPVTSATPVQVPSTSKPPGTAQPANEGGSTSKDSSTSNGNVGAIAGGVVAAFIVIIICVVVGVFLRRYLRDRNYDRPGPRQESNYTDLTVYEQVGNNSNNSAATTTNAAAANTNNTNTASSVPANPQAASSDTSNDYYNTSDTAAGGSTGHTYQNESFVSDNSRGVYDGLQMSDVGQQSAYTSLADRKTKK